jgi:hypothetical protein
MNNVLLEDYGIGMDAAQNEPFENINERAASIIAILHGKV